MKVRDLMTNEVVSVGADTTVDLVARLMDARGISGVPVVDDDLRLLGLITDRDMIARSTRLRPPLCLVLLDGHIPIETPTHYRKRVARLTGVFARDVMTVRAPTISPDADVEGLAELMVRGANPVPVVEDGRLVGIVSRADLIRMMAQPAAGWAAGPPPAYTSPSTASSTAERSSGTL